MITMNHSRKLLLLVCLFGLAWQYAAAQKAGSTAMQFLHVMPSARGTAMGDAYSTLALGAEAAFWNPSGLALAENQELSSTYINWIMDTQQGALSYALPINTIGVIGLQLQYVDFGQIEEVSVLPPYISNPEHPGLTGRTFRPFSYLVGLSFARLLTEKFAIGGSVKYAHESLFDGSEVLAMVSNNTYESVKTWSGVFLFDVGLRYNTGYRSVQLGAAVQNFGPEAEYAKESNAAPLLFRVGVAADLVGLDALLVSGQEDNRLTAAFDLFQPNDFAQQEHVGIEYEYARTFAIRAGYKLNYDADGLTLGAGIKHTLGSVGLSFDYSYGSLGTYLGSVQRFSLGAEIR
jgi:hypothetical protein